jgi:hypothetical protein
LEYNSIDIPLVEIPPLIIYPSFGLRVYDLRVVETRVDSNPVTNKSDDDKEQNTYYLFHFNLKKSHFQYSI